LTCENLREFPKEIRNDPNVIFMGMGEDDEKPEKSGSFLKKGDLVWDFLFFTYYIQHCFICRPSDSTLPTDAGIEPRTVATGALAVRRSNHYVRSHPHGFDLTWDLARSYQGLA
jgi:hypothetical protein